MSLRRNIALMGLARTGTTALTIALLGITLTPTDTAQSIALPTSADAASLRASALDISPTADVEASRDCLSVECSAPEATVDAEVVSTVAEALPVESIAEVVASASATAVADPSATLAECVAVSATAEVSNPLAGVMAARVTTEVV